MQKFPTRRYEALGDGVFAIVMTLLVLELSLPVASNPGTRAELPSLLLKMWPEYTSYLVSFLFLSLWWLVHGSILDDIKQMDGPLIWLNFLFLMLVGLIPFSTSLAARYWGEPITGVIYGLNLAIPLAVSLGFSSHANSTAGLTEVEVDPGFARRERTTGTVIVLVLLGGACLSLVNPVIPYIVYGGMGAFYVVAIWHGREGLSATTPGPRGPQFE
jgi:uncharacterized membrane protein